MSDRSECVVIAATVAGAAALRAVLPSESDVTTVVVGQRPRDVESTADSLRSSRVVVVPDVEYEGGGDRLGRSLESFFDSRLVVLDSSQPSRDLSGWAVAARGAALVWAVESISFDPTGVVQARRIVLGGSHRLVHELDPHRTTVVMARPSSRPAGGGRAAVHVHRAEPGPSRIRIVERAEAAGEDRVPLSAARIVVSIGRGIRGPENVPLFRRLADRLGASLGGSRAVVDAGWLPFAFQIGQTGATVAPDIYLAFGISGAIQHQAGMRGSRSVISVNTDPEAPLCRMSDLVVEGDAVGVASELLGRLESEGEGA